MPACLPDTTSVYSFLQRPSMVDFPGRMAAVFFTSGCNMACGFCHNAGLLQRRRAGFEADRLADVVRRFRADWVDAVVITGGEPTLCPDLDALVDFFRGQGLKVKLDTNGTHPEVLEALLPRLDYVAMDVKCSPARLRDLTGFADPGAIRTSIDLIKRAARSYEFRTTVITSFHTDAEMREIGKSVNGAARHVLQPFVPHEDLPDPALRNEPRTSPERLRYLGQLMRAYVDEVIVRGET